MSERNARAPAQPVKNLAWSTEPREGWNWVRYSTGEEVVNPIYNPTKQDGYEYNIILTPTQAQGLASCAVIAAEEFWHLLEACSTSDTERVARIVRAKIGG